MGERSCESSIKSTTAYPGSTRYLYDLFGNRKDLGSKTPEQNASEEMDITCQRCNVKEWFRVEGKPPDGARFAAQRKAYDFLLEHCQKYRVYCDRQVRLPEDSFDLTSFYPRRFR